MIMNKFLGVVAFFLLFSCSTDCSECQNSLKKWMYTSSVPVDLPAASPNDGLDDGLIIEVAVTAENNYVYEDETYSYEELEPLLLEAFTDSINPTSKLKIKGDAMADYGFVFQLISFAKTNELSPILVFE